MAGRIVTPSPASFAMFSSAMGLRGVSASRSTGPWCSLRQTAATRGIRVSAIPAAILARVVPEHGTMAAASYRADPEAISAVWSSGGQVRVASFPRSFAVSPVSRATTFSASRVRTRSTSWAFRCRRRVTAYGAPEAPVTPRTIRISLRDDLERPALDDEREVRPVVLRLAHLDHRQEEVHVPLVLLHLEVEDAVRKELLDAVLAEEQLVRLEHLRDEERGHPNRPQAVEEVEHVVPGVLEVRERVERGERVEDEHAAPELHFVVRDRREDGLGPVEGLLPLGVRLLPQASHVDDDDAAGALDRPRVHAEAGRVVPHPLAGLLQRQVDAPAPLALRRVVEDAEREGGLHGPRASAEEDDLACEDPPAHLLVDR